MEDKNEPIEEQKTPETLPEGFLIAGRYQIIRCIGIGGFGMIYLSEDRNLHRQVAVKEYFPRQWAEREDEYVSVKKSSMVDAFRLGMQSFLGEAQIMSRLADTPHVITFYDVLQANDTVYLVMEYIDGISVGRSLRERGYRPYTPKETAWILLPALEGLGQMHGKGIIHSDISPGNIMCSKEGEICLIDLGAAKDYKEKAPVFNAAFLKPDYAAPEQFRTAREGIPEDEGPWTDIYAVGGTMYYLLTGHKLTDAISRLNGNHTELEDPKKYKVRLPGKWMKLIRQAMALEIKDRISSADELSGRIKKLI